MDKKKVQSFRTRINRAKNTLSICGDLMLTMDIDAMTMANRMFLKRALLDSRKPLSYKYLDQKITEDINKWLN